MSRWQPVPVAGGAYTDDVKPWASQDCLNRLPVVGEREGTRSPSMLRDAPGCTVFSVLGSNAPVRGMHNAEGKLFVVSGQTLYQVSVTGLATSLGTIPGVERVSMAHNQITDGNELAIANGQDGYVYNTKTGVLEKITDEGFPGAKVFDFCDGYMMFVEPQGRYWGHSDLAAAKDYNTLDRSEAEAQPDRIITAAVSHREWVVFGERSTEFYRNEGGATGTFQRINGTEAEIGAAGTHTVAKLDNTLFVVGNDGIGYRLNGYQFVRITTHAIEQAWARCLLEFAYCYTFEDRGHKVWYVTMTDGQTWGYDVATGEWHRRKSYGLDFWRMACLIRWNSEWIGGDYSNGKLYELDWRLSNEAGVQLERSRTFAVTHNDQNRVHMNALELVYDTGITKVSPPLPQPILTPLTISGDLPNGTVNAAYTAYTYASAGGVLPHTFAIASGALPTGLTMSTAGVVTGTPTVVGSFSWTVRVTDADATTATLADTAAIVFSGVLDAPDTNVGTPCAATSYSYTYVAGGGTAPYTYAVVSGTLPTGLSLVGATGVLSGTPTVVQVSSFTIRVTDAAARTADYADTITVAAHNGAAACTWNPADKHADITLSGGDLTATSAVANNRAVRATSFRAAGKHYFEVLISTKGGGAASSPKIAVSQCGTALDNDMGDVATEWAYQASGNKYNNGVSAAFGAAFTTGDVVMVAVDIDAGKLWFGKNGTWQASGDPAAGTNAAYSSVTGPLFPAMSIYNADVCVLRGKASAFSYTAPTGFTAWDTNA